MKVTSFKLALALALGALAGTGVLLWGLHRLQVWLPPTSKQVVFVQGALALMVLAMGWRVRRYLAGKNPGLKAASAARAFLLAKAASYCGALLMGWYGAWLVEGLLVHSDRHTYAWGAGLALAGGLVLCAVGMLVERWCRVPPPAEPQVAAETGAA